MSKGPYLSYIADLGSKLALPKIKESLQKLTTGNIKDGYLQAFANSLKARSDSWRAASSNIRQAIEALEVAENALNEIASLSASLQGRHLHHHQLGQPIWFLLPLLLGQVQTLDES